MFDVRVEFDGATSEDVKAAVVVLRDILKGRKDVDKAAEKAAFAAIAAEAEAIGRAGAADASEGDGVLVIFKGVETKATFVKVTDKRFTVEIDGEKRSIMFDKLIEVTPVAKDEAVETEVDETEAVEAEVDETEGEDETVEADAEAV